MIVEHIHIETKKDLVEAIHSLSFTIEKKLSEASSHLEEVNP